MPGYLTIHGCVFNKMLQPDSTRVLYFYSKTNQMHNISNLFYFGTTLYRFLTVSPSIIRSIRLYIQHQVYVIQVLWLQPQNLYDIYLILYMQSQTPDDGRRDRPKHVESSSKKKKVNLSYCASGWFCYRTILRRMVLQTSSTYYNRLNYILYALRGVLNWYESTKI